MSSEIGRIIIIFSGWPILIAGSIFLIIMGRYVSRTTKNPPAEKTIKTLVASWLIAIYSLGTVTTAFLFCDGDTTTAVMIVTPIFIIWLATFFWTMYRFVKATYTLSGLNKETAGV